MATVIGGLVAGVAVGAWMSRDRVCFNAATRKGVFDGEWTIMRIFAVAVGVQLLLLPVLVLLGADLFSDSEALPAIGFFPVAQVIGGLVFGFGMALAGGCITGILWKSGAGSIATAIAIAGFAVGELLIRGGPIDGLRTSLDDAGPRPDTQTLYDLLGIAFAPVALVAGALILALLLRAGGNGVRAGVGLGVLGILTWLIVGLTDYGYGLGFVGSVESVERAVSDSDAGLVNFAFFLAIGVVIGGALALRGPLRTPDAPRALRAAAGGLAMGVGGTLAHGCNIGNGLTGIPLLSLGSILATAMMAVGIVVTWRYLVSDHPGLKGKETPQADW